MKLIFSSAVTLVVAAVALAAVPRIARGDTVEVVTDDTWLTTDVDPPSGWNFDDNFDTSGWIDAFQSPTGDHIWYGSNLSSESPSEAWFRQTFVLTSAVTSAVADIFFDDHGQVYLNGTKLIDYTSGDSTDFPGVVIDPSDFKVGENLLAIHGANVDPPYNNVGLDLQITTVPEPAFLFVLPAGLLLIRRRHRKSVVRRTPAFRSNPT